MNTIINFFMEHLIGKVSKAMIVFIVSLFPIVELRGGIVTGYALGLPLLKSFAVAYIGNMLPVPFILLLIKEIFKLIKLTPFGGIVDYFEKKAMSKSDQIEKYGYWGLFLFVAIPLPGTGAWTGSLIANLLELDFKKSIATIAVGVFTAGIIVSIFSFGLLNAIGIG